jgi:uncharacterized membrane protein
MNAKFFSRNIPHFQLAFILLVAAFLRFYHLSYQSFWLDELHTVREADPRGSFADLFQFLFYFDQHPPLFYTSEKVLFHIFGHSNEFIARSLPAVAGVLGVWAIYELGTTILTRRTGLIAAILLCVNPYHIFYSQDARPYSLLLLFACLSFIYLIKIVRDPQYKYSPAYGVCTLLMLYTHYFGMFVVAAQGVFLLLVFLFLASPESKRKLLYSGMLAFLIVGVGFSFRIPHLRAINAAPATWIPPVEPDFFIKTLAAFFNKSLYLIPFIVLFAVLAFYRLFRGTYPRVQTSGIDYERYPRMLLMLFSCWIVLTFLIPYVRSVLGMPMMVERYFITLLPAILLATALGIECIGNDIVRKMVIAAFLLLSIWQIAFVKQYYKTVGKAQFREMAVFIVKHPEYPVCAQTTAWHQAYYLEQFGFKQAIIGGPFSDFIKRAMSDTATLSGFWLADAHGQQKPDIAKQLESKYQLVDSVVLWDAWANLYLRKLPLKVDDSTTENKR